MDASQFSRNYEMFKSRVRDGETYTSIGMRHGIGRGRAWQIIKMFYKYLHHFENEGWVRRKLRG